MYEVTVEGSFAAAHHLPEHEGKCKNLHGHTYRVQATVAGHNLDARQGYLVDFGVLKEHLNAVLETLDHGCLNELPAFASQPPTSEHLARLIFDLLAKEQPGLSRVTVYESDRSWATWRTDR